MGPGMLQGGGQGLGGPGGWQRAGEGVQAAPPCSQGCHLSCRIFSHPNVLPVLGACQAPPAPHPIVISHWMPYGSLYNVLHEGTSECWGMVFLGAAGVSPATALGWA